MKNPQMFQQYENLKRNNGNPQDFLKDLTSKYSPEQMQQFQKFANGFGITNEQLTHYGIGAK